MSSSIHHLVTFPSRASVLRNSLEKIFEISSFLFRVRDPKTLVSDFLSTNWNKEKRHKEKRDDDFVFSSGKRVIKEEKTIIRFLCYFCLVVLITE